MMILAILAAVLISIIRIKKAVRFAEEAGRHIKRQVKGYINRKKRQAKSAARAAVAVVANATVETAMILYFYLIAKIAR